MDLEDYKKWTKEIQGIADHIQDNHDFHQRKIVTLETFIDKYVPIMI